MSSLIWAIDPVAFSIGPFDVRWYGLAYLTGFLVGWYYALKLVEYAQNKISSKAKNNTKLSTSSAHCNQYNQLTKTHIDDYIIWAILGVILGGRIGYILFYQFSFYSENPLSVFKLWQGGMSFHGGALGVILSSYLYAYYKKLSFLQLSDVIVCVVPIGLFFGRIANFINGELYGKVTDLPIGIVFPEAGLEPRHPTQLYEAICEGLLLFLICNFLYRNEFYKGRKGLISGVFLFSYASFRILIETVREPDAHLGYIWSNISMGQMLSIPMMLIGIYLVFRTWHKK